jgi:hypothetical protein
MVGPSNDNSFIPKRNPASRPRRVASQQVYLLTLASYVLFFATIVASIGVFLYDRYTKSQLEQEVVALDEAISRFKESDMNEVRSFDLRLTQARERVHHLVSLPSLFVALESATAETVRIKNLVLTREDDQGFILTASVETNNFDSSIFQREIFERNKTLQSATIESLDIGGQSTDAESGVTTPSGLVTFTAKIGVPLDSVIRSSIAPPILPEPNTSTTTDNAPAEGEEVVEDQVVETGFEQQSLEDLPVNSSEEGI